MTRARPRGIQPTAERLRRLRAARRRLERDLVRGLSPWERVQLARHPDRPSTLDHVQRPCTQFVELWPAAARVTGASAPISRRRKFAKPRSAR